MNQLTETFVSIRSSCKKEFNNIFGIDKINIDNT
jgi:hypothetical protein